jgi:hypothetical protein
VGWRNACRVGSETWEDRGAVLSSVIVGTAMAYDQSLNFEIVRACTRRGYQIVRVDQGCRKFGPYAFAPAFSQPNRSEGRANARRLAAGGSSGACDATSR